MKRLIFVVMLLTHGVSAKDMVLLDSGTNSSESHVMIRGNGEECRLYMSSGGRLLDTNCVRLINSKSVKVLCTRRKRMCKTENEVRDFVSGGNSLSGDIYKQCLDNAMNSFEMRECTQNEIEYQDGLLNRYYKQAMNRLPQREKNILRNAQRAWIKYRDSKCESEGEAMRGGSGEGLLVEGCIAKMTKERAEELKEKANISR